MILLEYLQSYGNINIQDIDKHTLTECNFHPECSYFI